MSGVISFGDESSKIWMKAGWAFRQVLDDVLLVYPYDMELEEAFERAKAISGLSVDDLNQELRQRVITRLRYTVTRLVNGSFESGITRLPYGDARTQAQYMECLQELLPMIPDLAYQLRRHSAQRADMSIAIRSKFCAVCGRALDTQSDPMSVDCGGDCWGCIGKLEAELGDEDSIARVNQEIAAGLRNPDGWPKPATEIH